MSSEAKYGGDPIAYWEGYLQALLHNKLPNDAVFEMLALVRELNGGKKKSNYTEDYVRGLEQKVEQLEAQWPEINYVNGLQESVKKLMAEKNTLQEQLETIQEKGSGVVLFRKGYVPELEMLVKELTEEKRQAEDKIKILQSTIESDRALLEEVRKKRDWAIEEKKASDAATDTLNNAVKRLNKKVEELKGTLVKAQAQLFNAKEKASSAWDSQKRLEKEVEKRKALEEDLKTRDRTLQELKNQIDKLKVVVENRESEVKAVRHALEDSNDKRTVLRREKDRLQKENDELKSQVKYWEEEKAVWRSILDRYNKARAEQYSQINLLTAAQAEDKRTIETLLHYRNSLEEKVAVLERHQKEWWGMAENLGGAVMSLERIESLRRVTNWVKQVEGENQGDINKQIVQDAEELIQWHEAFLQKE